MEFLDENFYIIALENFLFVETPGEAETSISGLSLYDESPFFTSDGTDERENRKEMAPKSPVFAPKEIVREEIMNRIWVYRQFVHRS